MLQRIVAAAVLAGLALAAPASAASIAPVNPQQLQIPATGADFNNLIGAINAILLPLLPTVSGSVNAVSLIPAVTGSPAVIGLQPGADSSAGIQIDPNTTGNIILFGQGDTGVLKFGNQAGFIPATGLAACPAVAGNRPLLVNATVQGYVPIQDWLGRSHAIPVC